LLNIISKLPSNHKINKTMKRIFAIVCLAAFIISLSSCAAMRKRKCNKCPKFSKQEIELQQLEKELCALEIMPGTTSN